MAAKKSRSVKAAPDTVKTLEPAQLSNCEFFGDFSTAERRQILAVSRVHKLGSGEQLFAEGEPCGALHLVLQGELKMSKISEDGKEQVMRHIRKGQVFGAAPLFTPKGIFPATAVSLEPSSVLSVPKEKLVALFRKNPELGLKALAFVSQHLQEMMRLVESVSLDKVPRRLASHLLKLAEAQNGPKPGQALRLGQTQSALAAELGTVREVVGRTLRQFESKGWIAMQGDGLILKDPEALRGA